MKLVIKYDVDFLKLSYENSKKLKKYLPYGLFYDMERLE